jgi:glycerol-3-phosphate dehydrogenase subunit B
MSANGEVIVIGEGLSGIMAAAASAMQGQRVTLVSKGPGNFVLGSTAIDLSDIRYDNLKVPDDLMDEAVNFFVALTANAECAFHGGMHERRMTPTLLGTFQQVSLAPRSLWQADPRQTSKVVIVGIANLPAFDPNFLAERLSFQAAQMGLKTSYRGEIVSLPHNPKHALTALEIASHIDRDEAYRTALAHAVRPVVRDAELIILPGVLGVKSSDAEVVSFEKEVGCAVCELATLPPSVPGLRTLQRLERRLGQLGVEVSSGFAVHKLCIEAGRCVAVELETPGRPRRLRAENFVLACGRYAEFLKSLPAAETDPFANVFKSGSLLVKSEPRHRNAVSLLTGYQAGLLTSKQGVQYAGR